MTRATGPMGFERPSRAARSWLGVAAAVALSAATASAQISGVSQNATGSTGSPANNADGSTTFGSAVNVNTGTVLQTRHAFNVNSDVGVGSTRDQSGTAIHNVSFTATAPGGYRLDLSTNRVGDLNRLSDAGGCDGNATIGSLTAPTITPPLSSGSLTFGGASLGNGGSTVSSPFNQTASGIIFRVSNGVGQSHTFAFNYTANTRSNSCEAAVRVGAQNGTTTGCSACEYPGSPSRTQANDGLFFNVTFTSLCGNSVVDAAVSEQCDQGAANGTPTSCCTSTCQYRAPGQVCRPDAGVCDLQETCTGSSGTCPADAKVTAGTLCDSGSGDLCDPDDFCDGVNNACPNTIASAGTPCRVGSGDLCDPTETCTGVPDQACPADVVAPGGTSCRGGSGDICDPEETCTGVALQACPADVVAPGGTLCRTGSGDLCDPDETCTGIASQACPADVVTPGGTPCRTGSGDLCDPDETCTGVAGQSCPADVVAPGGTLCNPGSGDLCDPDEVCSGVALQACPADTVTPAGTLCRGGSGDLCDPDETCTGVADQPCPADVISPSGTVCNPGSGDACDPDEVCSGSPGDPCPADAVAPSGTVCRTGSGDSCDPDELCSGTADDPCPADTVQPGGTLCRAGSGDICDPDEFCTGSPGDACPADSVSGAFVECRPVADVCDVAENCTGVAGQACPADAFEPATTVCRSSTDTCDIAETCTGTGPSCPADTGLPDGDGDGTCDAIDNCVSEVNPGQEDGDSDALGDACDPCTNVGPSSPSKQKLTLTKLTSGAGQQKVSFTSFFTGVPTSPPINPLAGGSRFLVLDSLGTTVIDAAIPPGAYVAANKAGWKVNGAGTSWTYKNAGTIVPLIQGITTVGVKAYPSTPGRYKVKVKGKNGTYAVNQANLPLTGTIVLDPPVATTGQCGEATFTATFPARPSCVSASGNKTVKCK